MIWRVAARLGGWSTGSETVGLRMGVCIRCRVVPYHRIPSRGGYHLKYSETKMELFYHYIFIISQLRLTSHPRSTVVLLDTETPGTSREIYNEDAEGEARTRNPWITNPVL